MPNETDEDPNYPGGRIWDLDKLWDKLCKAAQVVTSQIDVTRIAGITGDYFWSRCAFIDDKGGLLYR